MKGFLVKRYLVILMTCLLTIMVIAPIATFAQSVTGVYSSHAAASTNWPTYLFNNERSSFNSSETIINPTSAPHLKLKWTAKSSGCPNSPGGPIDITAQVVVMQSLQRIYWGSWDGCEHASDLSGHQVWATYIGQTTSTKCGIPKIGVGSTATVATETIGTTKTPVLLVGGGNAYFYALNALTGAVIWKTQLGSATGSYIWSSPAVYQGRVYEGLSSLLDCPLVQGKFFKLNASTGVIQNTFNVVPNGCIGGSVWGSPAIDAAAKTVYFATGNAGTCSQPETYAASLIELSLSNLALIGSWQVPQAQQVVDSDFGSTPTLFQATIGGQLQLLVGLENKNGIYYTFARGNLSKGPVWTATIVDSSKTPQPDTFSPSAWDGSHLYVAGSHATISGTTCQGNNNEGSLQALNPANGSFLWQKCLVSGNVGGPVTAVPGVAEVGAGPNMVLVATNSGKTLFTYKSTNTGDRFPAPAAISNGVLYIGSEFGNLYAFGL